MYLFMYLIKFNLHCETHNINIMSVIENDDQTVSLGLSDHFLTYCTRKVVKRAV